MATRGTGHRLQRLDELQGLLKERDFVTVGELARELGASVRTINRDIEILRERGLPIDSDRGRGGGLRLQANWGIGRLHLSSAEAIDLLLSMAIAERMNSPLLLQQLASVRRKIAAAFSENYQTKIRALRKRILIGSPASPAVVSSLVDPVRKMGTTIVDAFFNMRCVTIVYVDQSGTETERMVEPHYLYFNVPVWYLLAWDRLRGAVRFFRIDRIKSVTSSDKHFRLANPAPFLGVAEEGIETL